MERSEADCECPLYNKKQICGRKTAGLLFNRIAKWIANVLSALQRKIKRKKKNETYDSRR